MSIIIIIIKLGITTTSVDLWQSTNIIRCLSWKTTVRIKLNRPPFASIVWYFLLLFTATFLSETAFFNYDHSFLKLNRSCLLWHLSPQVTSYSALSSLCILTVHIQHATSMSNSTSIRHSPPGARSILIPCILIRSTFMSVDQMFTYVGADAINKWIEQKTIKMVNYSRLKPRYSLFTTNNMT